MRLPFALACACACACAGSPVEAETIGGTADSSEGTAVTSPSSSATASATSPDGSAGDPSGDPTGDPSGDPSGDPTGDPSGEASTDTGATDTSGAKGTSDSSTSSSDEATGDGGGCLGEPLPEVPPQVCSMRSATPAELEIENECAYSIRVLWVDDDCDEISYQVVSGEDSWSVSSFVTHPWRIRNQQTGELILEIPPLSGDTSIVVQ